MDSSSRVPNPQTKLSRTAGNKVQLQFHLHLMVVSDVTNAKSSGSTEATAGKMELVNLIRYFVTG